MSERVRSAVGHTIGRLPLTLAAPRAPAQSARDRSRRRHSYTTGGDMMIREGRSHSIDVFTLITWAAYGMRAYLCSCSRFGIARSWRRICEAVQVSIARQVARRHSHPRCFGARDERERRTPRGREDIHHTAAAAAASRGQEKSYKHLVATSARLDTLAPLVS